MKSLSERGPGFLLWLTTLETILLGFLLLARRFEWLGVDDLPAEIGGVLPLIVPWGGALGGIAICFVGLATHWEKWTTKQATEGRRWNAWYVVRAPLGAILGSVGALMVVFVLGTIGTTDAGDIDISPRGAVVLMLIAFVLGYRQETFAELIARVVDVVLGPGETVTTTGFSVSPTPLTFSTSVNNPVEEELSVTNEGSQLLRLPRSVFSITGDNSDLFTITAYPGNVPADGVGTVRIRYTPVAAGPHGATLNIEAASVTQAVPLTGATT